MSQAITKPVALTVAGADSSGGAGVHADLKTFAAWGVHGTAAITAVTAQNSLSCEAVHPVPGPVVRTQIETLLQDMPIAFCKIGMLANEDIVTQVAQCLGATPVQIVCDPVLQSSTGSPLLSQGGVEAFKTHLLPQVFLLTPNLPEAETLCGQAIDSPQKQKEACEQLVSLGAQNVLLKGGHLKTDPIDLLFDGEHFFEMKANRQNTNNPHGTGCVLSAAITAALTLGHDFPRRSSTPMPSSKKPFSPATVAVKARGPSILCLPFHRALRTPKGPSPSKRCMEKAKASKPNKSKTLNGSTPATWRLKRRSPAHWLASFVICALPCVGF